ncbi:MAG: hypothetical protein M0R06_11365 [Sphaerochaeta sp.]|jgi:hypothetical protein|nr:hypothetical protein [Sphaerochaeta sp.]
MKENKEEKDYWLKNLFIPICGFIMIPVSLVALANFMNAAFADSPTMIWEAIKLMLTAICIVSLCIIGSSIKKGDDGKVHYDRDWYKPDA